MLRIPAIRSSEGKPERDPAARRARLRRDAGPAGVTVLGLSLEHGSTASAITGGGSEPTAALGAEDGSRFRARTVHRTGGLGDAGYGMRLRCGRVSHPTSRISHLGAERRDGCGGLFCLLLLLIGIPPLSGGPARLDFPEGGPPQAR